MTRLARFARRPPADRRLLLLSAVLHPLVSIALRILPFARVQRLLALGAAIAPRPPAVADIETRVPQAVRTIASLRRGSHCLCDALIAQCLLSRYGVDTTLCFGVARGALDGRPFDGHAWLERGGAPVIGARTVAYRPLGHPTRCVPSSSSR
jgi:Transglutaminase-like superfamily